MSDDLTQRCPLCNRMLYTTEPMPFQHDTCRQCRLIASGWRPVGMDALTGYLEGGKRTTALYKARETLAVYDAGTHFNAKEVLIVLRALVDEISTQQRGGGQ